MVARDPERNRDAIARGCRKLREAGRVLPAKYELAAGIIEGREEMVEERSPDDTVDTLRAKALRELAQGIITTGRFFTVQSPSVRDSICPC